MPTLKSILFFNAMVTAVECSAAFPTMATMITPTNASVMPREARTYSIVPTRNSESSATSAVANSNIVKDFARDQSLRLTSASLPWPRKSCLCVFKVKLRTQA